MGEAPIQTGVRLGVWGVSWVRKTIQEVGLCNVPPYLRKQRFPKSFQAALRVLSVPDPVSIELEDFDMREGCILEISIDQQGVA